MLPQVGMVHEPPALTSTPSAGGSGLAVAIVLTMLLLLLGTTFAATTGTAAR